MAGVVVVAAVVWRVGDVILRLAGEVVAAVAPVYLDKQ